MNAIILAAGMGTRLRPLTNDIPKCLVKVCGTPMVERQIQFLHEAGIRDITLVSGYKAERLDYLKAQYGVDIIFNERYDTCNNIWSMVKVLDRFGDSYVLEGDVYMHRNCLTTEIDKPTYFAKWHDHYDNEWGLEVDGQNCLTRVNIGLGTGYIMSGISYWPEESATIIKQRINALVAGGDYTNLFWDNAAIDVLPQMQVVVKPCNDLYEIDTQAELNTVESHLLEGRSETE